MPFTTWKYEHRGLEIHCSAYLQGEGRRYVAQAVVVQRSGANAPRVITVPVPLGENHGSAAEAARAGLEHARRFVDDYVLAAGA
jgi:hypothetical protein